MNPTIRYATASIAAAFLASWCSGCATWRRPPPQPVTVPEIVEMSKAGVPAGDIIAKIQASGTIYRLKASQLSQLEKDGVPAAVIDHMQQTYLDAVRRDGQYEEWRYWTLNHDYWYGGAPWGWPRERVYIVPRRHRR